MRIGLHTGEPLVTDEGYVGIDVHRAARIAAVGHGGQVLISRSTCDLVGADGLRYLGDHRLKDLTGPERIYQLGDGDFPPLRSLNATNLPVASNPLVGRERELAELSAMLLGSERLVTLTGPGGSGKTRLCLQVGAELLEAFPGGVFFVRLAPLSSPELVRPAIAQAVGLPDLREIADRDALLLLDNFEHVLDAAADVAALLEAGGAVKVLATRTTPSSCWCSARVRCGATSSRTSARRRSAAVSTVCRLHSSSQLPGYARSMRPRCSAASTVDCHC
jgi:hypothetical protein